MFRPKCCLGSEQCMNSGYRPYMLQKQCNLSLVSIFGRKLLKTEGCGQQRGNVFTWWHRCHRQHLRCRVKKLLLFWSLQKQKGKDQQGRKVRFQELSQPSAFVWSHFQRFHWQVSWRRLFVCFGELELSKLTKRTQFFNQHLWRDWGALVENHCTLEEAIFLSLRLHLKERLVSTRTTDGSSSIGTGLAPSPLFLDPTLCPAYHTWSRHSAHTYPVQVVYPVR